MQMLEVVAHQDSGPQSNLLYLFAFYESEREPHFDGPRRLA